MSDDGKLTDEKKGFSCSSNRSIRHEDKWKVLSKEGRKSLTLKVGM